MNTNELGWIGRYGSKLLALLKEHDSDKYTSLLFEGTLKDYLLAQDEYISGRIWDLTMELAKKNSVNEDLKRRDQLRWVQEVNSFRNMAEKMVFAEYFE
ncbi:MAG: TnpV protein [Clostridia bacterium]|nr:TnpV protein [Clostridia bacterium]